MDSQTTYTYRNQPYVNDSANTQIPTNCDPSNIIDRLRTELAELFLVGRTRHYLESIQKTAKRKLKSINFRTFSFGSVREPRMSSFKSVSGVAACFNLCAAEQGGAFQVPRNQ